MFGIEAGLACGFGIHERGDFDGSPDVAVHGEHLFEILLGAVVDELLKLKRRFDCGRHERSRGAAGGVVAVELGTEGMKANNKAFDQNALCRCERRKELVKRRLWGAARESKTTH